MVDVESLIGFEITQHRFAAVWPRDGKRLYPFRLAESEQLIRRIVRREIAAEQHFPHEIPISDAERDSRPHRLGVRRCALEFHGQIAVALGVVPPKRRRMPPPGVHLQDVRVPVVVEVGTDDTATLVGIVKAEVGCAVVECRPAV